ncbi:hypothetical protein FLP10_12440 [Agromyces intestinalis]|uniref:Uncharacterized protein n=1 Tax=Agromyces intestinalis TaxID=2592652 RepID=A0A5C1YGM0_9MICO|nr:hypothetical protein [Agromyces intestinalis]QEO15131.1 hypothetical protein FLP10_12440 [Agromyces intestinalis]
MTIQEARRRLEQYFAEHPPALSGQLYIGSEWWEDADDYLPYWGAREYIVDGRLEFNRMDNLAIFIDKRTGEVRREYFTPNFDKIAGMTRVDAPDA